jgi:hypothetical protein
MFALLTVAVSMFSQANTGLILGTVTDQSGGVVANATVTVLDVQRGVSRTLKADAAGEYAAPNLTPGTYDVRAEAPGFNTAEHSNILLEVGKELRIDLILQPGEQTQTIKVTESVPLVETTNATLGGTLSNQTINDLPMNGRNYQNLLDLLPGVTQYQGGGGFTREANGLRAEANTYLIDGLLDVDPNTGLSIVNGPSVAGESTSILPIDAIQEFNTVINGKAEYGWRGGPAIDVGLKSGTNNIHGTAYAFGRETGFDARNYFNPAPQTKLPVALKQFGATVGGPIKKDRLFYFMGFEGQYYNVGSTYIDATPATVPLTPAQDPNNTLSIVDACNALRTAGKPINALSAQLAGLNPGTCAISQSSSTVENLFPVNNGTNPLGVTAFAPGLISQNSESNGIAKIDYHINDHHAVNGMFFVGFQDGTWNTQPQQLASQWEQLIPARTYEGSGGWIWTPNSRWVNEARIGYTYFKRSNFSVDHNVNPASPWPQGYGINTGVTNPLYFGMPALIISGFTNFELGAISAPNPGFIGPNGDYDFVEHLSYLRGKHALKFGGEFLHDYIFSGSYNFALGSIRFGSLQNYLQGIPSRGNILVGTPSANVSDNRYAIFVQDDWRFTPRLMINLGLRYEYASPYKERNSKEGSFSPTSGLIQASSGSSSVYNGDHKDFSPRLGVAWDVKGDGKTVIRSGAALIYDQTAFSPLAGVLNVPTGASLTVLNASGQPVTTAGAGTIAAANVTVPGASLAWNTSGPIFPDTAAVKCGDGLKPVGAAAADPGPCNAFMVDPNLRTPYVVNWSLGVQRSLRNNLAVDVSYVGNHATGLLGQTDVNQAPLGAGYSPTCVGSVSACEQAARPFNAQFPYLKFIEQVSNLDISNYNGLQATLTQRTSHGLSFVAGYTYSHALDDVSVRKIFQPLNSFDPKLEYASSDFDLRHRFTLSTTYALPGKKAWGQLLEGWQLNSLITLQTGQPWNFMDTSNDFSGTGEVGNPAMPGERWNFFGNPNDFRSSQNDIPFCTGPGSGGCLGTAGQPLSAAVSSVMWSECSAHAPASALGPGCFVEGNSVMVPPALGSYGTSGRNIFRDSGFKDWDVSVTKIWKVKELLTAQFRVEFFNILNHPNFANPWGGPNGYANNDPSAGIGAGCGCVTPDQAASNPVLGSGGPREIQLGLKLIF